MDKPKTVATDIPPNPPDFRFLEVGHGEQLLCKCNKDKGYSGSRFIVYTTDSAITVECDNCSHKYVIIANKLAE